MRETVLAFAPLGVALYFLCYPSQFAHLVVSASHLLR
jgi:hypothetical protein